MEYGDGRMRALLSVAGFFPYTLALFLNAFTDLGHKIIIQNTVFVVYDEQTQIMLAALVNALVLLPYVLLFTPAGYISDRFAKSVVMRRAAFAAVVLTSGITFAYYQGWFLIAFALTFLLALQSAVYAPAKYGYIKELAGNAHLSAGNAAVQSVTTVAILSGIIVYTVLFEQRLGTLKMEDPSQVVRQIAPLGWLLIAGSLVEWGLLFFIPFHNAAQGHLRFQFRPYLGGVYLRQNLKTLFHDREVGVAVLALSVYWGIAQVVLAVFGAFAKSHLHEQSVTVVQGVMALSAVGIMLGAFIAAEVSRSEIRMGLAPLGMGGMATALLLIPLASSAMGTVPLFLLFGVAAGLFLVPLNAYIQRYTPNVHLGTVLAGNNFIQTLFMLAGLGLTTFIAYEGADSVAVLWLSAAAALAAALYLLRRYAFEALRLAVGFLAAVRYRIEAAGAEHLPAQGGVLLLGNHVSWLDWMLLQLIVPRRIHFMVDRDIYKLGVFHAVLRRAGAIPVSPRASKEAFALAAAALNRGEAVALFPEGGITEDGETGKFYRGFEIMASDVSGGVIVPFRIEGMYGSLFSYAPARHCEDRVGLRRRVRISFAPPMPTDANAQSVRNSVIALKKDTIAQ